MPMLKSLEMEVFPLNFSQFPKKLEFHKIKKELRDLDESISLLPKFRLIKNIGIESKEIQSIT